jgi:signal transduction histidine kinase
VEKLESKVRELTATNERMRRVDELKTEFMRSISHELSTPLTPLLGYLKIFHGEKLGPLNERQTKVVESMIQSTERLSRTVDNLSDFAVLETGNYRVRAEPVDLVALAIRLIEQTQVTLGKPKRVHISLEAPGRNVILMADPARLTQAVGNLIENAVKLSPHGGEVLVEISDSDDRARISVYDQGTGVLTEDQDKVFEPYYRSRDARHMATAGLGLPVARKIAEAHGGRLIVESPPKLQPESERHFSGSKFILELPSPPKH